MSGTVYLPGDTIPITDVGDGFPLVCVTSNVNTNCCRGGDNPGSGPVGNWLYLNGTIVLGNSANPNGDLTRSSHAQQIRLNRKRPDVMSPTGVYTCQVPDGSNTVIIHTATITLGECMYTIKYNNIFTIARGLLVVMITGGGGGGVFTVGVSPAQLVEVHPRHTPISG